MRQRKRDTEGYIYINTHTQTQRKTDIHIHTQREALIACHPCHLSGPLPGTLWPSGDGILMLGCFSCSLCLAGLLLEAVLQGSSQGVAAACCDQCLHYTTLGKQTQCQSQAANYGCFYTTSKQESSRRTPGIVQITLESTCWPL